MLKVHLFKDGVYSQVCYRIEAIKWESIIEDKIETEIQSLQKRLTSSCSVHILSNMIDETIQSSRPAEGDNADKDVNANMLYDKKTFDVIKPVNRAYSANAPEPVDTKTVNRANPANAPESVDTKTVDTQTFDTTKPIDTSKPVMNIELVESNTQNKEGKIQSIKRELSSSVIGLNLRKKSK